MAQSFGAGRCVTRIVKISSCRRITGYTLDVMRRVETKRNIKTCKDDYITVASPLRGKHFGATRLDLVRGSCQPARPTWKDLD